MPILRGSLRRQHDCFAVIALPFVVIVSCSSDEATPGTDSNAGVGAAPTSGSSAGPSAGSPSNGGRPGAGNGGSSAGSPGGAPSAGAASGGDDPRGGSAAGGDDASAGNLSGGSATGGASSGGGAAGGNSGGCVPAECGSHKWACWKMPNPVTSPAAVPHKQSYTDLGNGAVRDNVTCLVWEKANPATQGTWQQSFDRCAALAEDNFAGFDAWRLPTRIEMASITDVTLGSRGYPAVFTVTSGYYVTGSFWYKTILTANEPAAEREDMVWGYGTNGFTSNAIVRSNTNNVARCVHGNGSGEAAGEYAQEPPNHYAVANGEVTDHYTGLVWQQGRSPSLMPWSAAASYCASLNLNGQTWRVPTLNELATTVDEAKVGGAINGTVFPNNPVGCREPQYWFWAAEASRVGGTAWGLSYCDGFTGWNVGASGDWNYFPEANVRCVR